MDDGPAFEDVLPDLEVAGRLIAAAANGDEDVEELEADWWNVAWTLALLIRGVRNGEPAALELVDLYMQAPRDT